MPGALGGRTGDNSMAGSAVDVACVGMLVVDFFSSPLPRLPKPGELMVVDEISLFTGGCACNTAVALAKLGVKTGVIGKVGQDSLGQFVIDDLAAKGIETSQISTSKLNDTCKTIIISTVSEDRRYIHMVGSNQDFGIDDVNFDYLSTAKMLYIGGYLLLPKIDQDALKRILSFAKENGTITVLDVVSPGEGDLLGQCKDVLRYVDVFVPNDDEARDLTGEDIPERQADALLGYGPGTVIITMGDRGCLLKTKDTLIRTPAYDVEFVDASGGGDAFDAGLIVGLLNKWPLEDTLKFASAMGASCVRKLGCAAGLFTRQEAEDFVRNNTLKMEVKALG